jgi:alpha-tubulin suppressor-like RCC1 family protein
LETQALLVCYRNYPNKLAKSTPISVSLAKNITKIAVAGTFSFALATDNTLWVWGVLHYMNSASVVVVSVGDGTSTYKSTPVAVSMAVFTSKTISDIKAGTSNAMVLTTDGSVFSTGYNAYYAVRKTKQYNIIGC